MLRKPPFGRGAAAQAGPPAGWSGLQPLLPFAILDDKSGGENPDGAFPPSLFARPCGRESLAFALPPGHRFAGRESLSFTEMNGETIILMDNIGFWNFVRTEKMPDSRFLIQSDSFSFQELLRSSTLPAFTTDLAKIYLKQTPGRIEVPVSDPEGSVTYYLVCRRETAPAFRALFAAL